ncbi:hypothetical protein M3202_15385 [Alkalihalobacillus oceani]|uniref:Uncharacterized protein n=1 Tax=Halalkalibacter oceani TaxID=1653776 RepID=A0A9X2DU57_9BACI|nr:hypothetical protein [Halalkalibacter oceani]MCM3715453.1 hypothetical protein [Halalkalibacter oceani]
MILPAIDVGLMAEHLSTHEGVLHKLEHDYHKVKNPVLQQVIAQQFRIMRAHIKVMLSLLDPNQHQWIHLPPLDESVVTFNLSSTTHGNTFGR